MGTILKRMVQSFFAFPVQPHTICFLRQEEYNSTGELLNEDRRRKEDEYEKVLQNFVENLRAKKKMTRAMIENHQMESMKEVLIHYPGWNDLTVSILHQVYLLFADPVNSTLLFDDLCALLEYLGDKSAKEDRMRFFDKADQDKDGYIEYSEFLPGLYNYHPQKKKELHGMAKLCLVAGERSRVISSLTLGEQLEYGLF